MKKDIEIPKVKDVALAIIQEMSEDGNLVWMSYIVNMKEEDITGVLISTKGYGHKDGEHVKTSVLRHFFERIEKKSFQKIELITEDLIGLNNEFMLSFYIGSVIHDKKYIFLPEVIQIQNLTHVPVLEQPGILIV